VTKIDRYILYLFLRTVLVCFSSIAGIFIVFHAFTSMDDLVKQGQVEGGLVRVMARFYGPYMLLLFDWTGAIIALMAFLFTVGWIRRIGELTAVLSSGISHGRLFRPMIIASLMIVLVQLANREFVLPNYRDALSMKSKDIAGETDQQILAQYDKANRILIDGASLLPQTKVIHEPSFRLDGEYPGFGEVMVAKSAQWFDAQEDRPSGYLLSGVQLPTDIDTIPSVSLRSRPILLTRRDQPWLTPNQCFFATTVHTGLLQTNQTATRLASVAELVDRVRNPAVHSSTSLHVLMHERIIRPPLDFALIMLGLPMVVNRRGRNIFVMIAACMLTVLFFFALKTVAGAMGGGGYVLSPTMAAWIPLLVLGPIAYVRLRDVQLV
jgi:lipopolysaccharide export system permease protein